MNNDEEILATDEYMPNETFFIPPEDEEQVKEENTERAMVTGGQHLIEEILTWFDDEIAWAKSIHGLDPESMSLPEQVLAKQRIEKFMTEARGRLERLNNQYLEPK